MFLDLINSFLELWAFLVLFLVFTNWNITLKQLSIYCILSITLSVLFSFVLVPQILVLNIGLVLGIILLTYYRGNLFTRIICSSLSVLSILFLEFTLYSLLPSSLLHTHWGNFITNLVILLGSLLVLFWIRKTESGEILSSFITRFFPLIIFLLIVLIVLGQVYISKLSPEWHLLPAIVGIIFLLSVIICLSLYIHFINTIRKKQNDLVIQNLDNTESIIKACHVDLHNYHSHINHLLNCIDSIDDIHLLRLETRQYINGLEKDRELMESIVALKEPLFRSTLYGWYVHCLEFNVPFSFDATSLLPAFPMKQYQLVEVLDILFNNALEYELLLPEKDRQIHVSLYADADISSFLIRNNVQDINQSLNDIYSGHSTKDGKHQGIGLKHIANLSKEYHFQFSTSADTETCAISFSISFQKEPQ